MSEVKKKCPTKQYENKNQISNIPFCLSCVVFNCWTTLGVTDTSIETALQRSFFSQYSTTNILSN